MNSATEKGNNVSGEFINMAGERFYAIRNVDQMAPFFISVVSNSDHWMFISSTGGLTAGRVSPENALFPYITVDKIHGCTVLKNDRCCLRMYCGDMFAPMPIYRMLGGGSSREIVSFRFVSFLRACAWSGCLLEFDRRRLCDLFPFRLCLSELSLVPSPPSPKPPIHF